MVKGNLAEAFKLVYLHNVSQREACRKTGTTQSVLSTTLDAVRTFKLNAQALQDAVDLEEVNREYHRLITKFKNEEGFVKIPSDEIKQAKLRLLKHEVYIEVELPKIQSTNARELLREITAATKAFADNPTKQTEQELMDTYERMI